ncbi:MAG: long-chain fatty acid--CoA ligase [Ferrovum sp. 37-45-19]|nr:MAG: long-chain fatty acid--CoA ligase [Ferrovum sp. 21-44-67]OYV94129.1 MAG: long-chain fatty acid--CoA ligase [Ferrovum sp. 37-45-19]HQT81395.1 long-chain-fatty-acid--CoA ligase [Ferrovaceae bacterium]HQU06282.1 long-chain-fatty-acid--CoA ligase [Ferrovaceae bacterium]
MFGLMMHSPLLISSLIEHAAKHHADTPIVSKEADGTMYRSNWREVHERSQLLARALIKLGIQPGDRVATLAWNTHRHVEAYYAISGIGAICHTINPRLFKEQISLIINHAEDKLIFIEKQFMPLMEELKLNNEALSLVVMDQDSSVLSSRYNTLNYEQLLKAVEPGAWSWPQLKENDASSLCYTSGTTGMPKGVLYSHRSTVLHAFAVALPDSLGLSARDSVLPVVPLFHANAWGIPYAAAMVGAKLVLPGHELGGAHLATLLKQEEVTVTAGVPTVWQGLINHLQHTQESLSHLERLGVGGAQCPLPIIQFFEQRGVRVMPGWGMTETSPVVTLMQPKYSQHQMSDEERLQWLTKSGRILYGADMKIVDEGGQELPQDGKAVGELYVRGHWVCQAYYQNDQSPLKAGWLATGDMATIDQAGFMQITDRAKDMIKSGGEWISSLTLEQIASTFNGVAEAAVIAAQHEYWGERPLLFIVPQAGVDIDTEQLLNHLQQHVAKWWVPDRVLMVKELPHTATGKLNKLSLRKTWGDELKKNPLNS